MKFDRASVVAGSQPMGAKKRLVHPDNARASHRQDPRPAGALRDARPQEIGHASVTVFLAFL